MNNSRATEVLIVCSDLHCGSDVGLAPPQTETKSGNIVTHGNNLHQAWLWEMWLLGLARVEEIIGKSKAALLVNGDATEGVHHRNEASTLAALIETHVEMARVCLEPLAKLCHKRFVTLGTECHTKHMEDNLAAALKAESGKARNEWLIEINGCLIDAKHHMNVSGRAHLEASAMSILMGNAVLNRARNKQRIPDIFLRAHRHCGGHYTDNTRLFGVTGAWQFLTRHGFKVVPDSIPQPTILVLDWRGKKYGELPDTKPIKFDQPQSEITTI